jgi:hypothetical protein
MWHSADSALCSIAQSCNSALCRIAQSCDYSFGCGSAGHAAAGEQLWAVIGAERVPSMQLFNFYSGLFPISRRWAFHWDRWPPHRSPFSAAELHGVPEDAVGQCRSFAYLPVTGQADYTCSGRNAAVGGRATTIAVWTWVTFLQAWPAAQYSQSYRSPEGALSSRRRQNHAKTAVIPPLGWSSLPACIHAFCFEERGHDFPEFNGPHLLWLALQLLLLGWLAGRIELCLQV